MSIARKCDRCEAFYDTYNDEYNSKNTSSIEKSNGMAFTFRYSNKTYDICKHFDLCPDCKDELVNWILEGGNES